MEAIFPGAILSFTRHIFPLLSPSGLPDEERLFIAPGSLRRLWLPLLTYVSTTHLVFR